MSIWGSSKAEQFGDDATNIRGRWFGSDERILKTYEKSKRSEERLMEAVVEPIKEVCVTVEGAEIGGRGTDVLAFQWNRNWQLNCASHCAVKQSWLEVKISNAPLAFLSIPISYSFWRPTEESGNNYRARHSDQIRLRYSGCTGFTSKGEGSHSSHSD